MTIKATAGKASRVIMCTPMPRPASRPMSGSRRMLPARRHRSASHTSSEQKSIAMLYTSLSTAENHTVSQNR